MECYLDPYSWRQNILSLYFVTFSSNRSNLFFLNFSQKIIEKAPPETKKGSNMTCPLCQKSFGGSAYARHVGTVHEIVVDCCMDAGIDLVEVIKNQKTAPDIVKNPDLKDPDPKDLASKAPETSNTSVYYF